MTQQPETQCDVAIIGSGPAGLATADTLQAAGLNCLVFESGCLAKNIARFPIYMQFFSTAPLVELRGFPLICPAGKPSRQEYLMYLARFQHDRALRVRLCEPVERVERTESGFVVHSERRADGRPRATAARYAVIATGAFDTPNPLGCPGEDLPKVSHYYTEPHPYIGSKVLVVGNGNSACEAALELHRAGIEVTLAIRTTSSASSNTGSCRTSRIGSRKALSRRTSTRPFGKSVPRARSSRPRRTAASRSRTTSCLP